MQQIKEYNFTLYQAIVIIEDYNNWRMGAEIPQPDPFVISSALKVLLDQAKKAIKINKLKS